jgi:hypothetical protein
LTAAIQAIVILVVSIALGVHIHTGVLGWLTIILAAILVNSAFAGSLRRSRSSRAAKRR